MCFLFSAASFHEIAICNSAGIGQVRYLGYTMDLFLEVEMNVIKSSHPPKKRKRQTVKYFSFACLIGCMHYGKYFFMSKQPQCLITLCCMFAVHDYKVHFSVPETPLTCLLCQATKAGIPVFGSLDTKTPVLLICFRNSFIYRQFPSNPDWYSFKEDTKVLGKVTLNVPVTLNY